jgi:hypothetical protein
MFNPLRNFPMNKRFFRLFMNPCTQSNTLPRPAGQFMNN